jgi:hypothetical protein
VAHAMTDEMAGDEIGNADFHVAGGFMLHQSVRDWLNPDKVHSVRA